jgi:hypothetical protein
MKATDYWKQQADELLGKKKDPAKGNEPATPTTNQNQTAGESISTPQKTNQLSQILDNLLEDEEDDGFMGNNDVLDDSVLDVESDFFASDRKEENNHYEKITINVVVLPRAWQNTNFSIKNAINLANVALQWYGGGYPQLSNMIRLKLYTERPKSLKNCIIIGQDHIELEENIAKYTNERWAIHCRKTTKIDSNGVNLIQPEGKKEWNPETSSDLVGNNFGGNYGIIRLDHMKFKTEGNPFDDTPVGNLAFVLLHVLGHNSSDSLHEEKEETQMGIMTDGEYISSLLNKAGEYISRPEFENYEKNSRIITAIFQRPKNMNFVFLTQEKFSAPTKKYTSGKSNVDINGYYGANAKYLYNLFNNLK